MVLRTIALVLFGFALCIALWAGWNYPMSNMLYGVNPSALGSAEIGAQRYLPSAFWRAVIAPMLALPAWSLPTMLGVILMIIAALRPGKG
jgi:hypothetical protein